ncbi:NAD-dependent epimerase/dehydratase family protein [Pedobacter sp. SYSU D00535]|uniref:NAD-dependent epimerase/dehydratase family protein n=1 Tax=Pedobacter sp. SYSU D00535 TaxID=2810308 RepID=UPI001A96F444|nr:NAD-dependent epimerase/dehydratase family protein [Pedobacter sp. SYSU D00535]
MVLVTGATGFLGSELVKQLSLAGEQVRVLRRPDSVIPTILRDIDTVEWVNADILDYFSLESALQGITKIYHCAAYISFRRSDKKKLLKLNREGTAHLVNLALDLGVEKFVHVSSVAALGEAKEGKPVSEQNHWEFNGTQHGYSISKYESEMEVWRGISEGLQAVVVNPSLIIGAGAGTKGSGQIFEMIRKGVKFYPSGSCGLVDVEDVARAMILLMNSDLSAERFILNAENWQYKELFVEAATCFGTKIPSVEAKSWMMELAWRGASIAAAFSGKDYGLTRDTARNSLKRLKYSNEKFLRHFPSFHYKPVKKSVEEICRALKD